MASHSNGEELDEETKAYRRYQLSLRNEIARCINEDRGKLLPQLSDRKPLRLLMNGGACEYDMSIYNGHIRYAILYNGHHAYELIVKQKDQR